MNFFYISTLIILVYACTSSTGRGDHAILEQEPDIGDQIDSLNHVHVFYNGPSYKHSQGKHYAQDGYYYGQKGQCVEFVKRYYHDALDHNMPNVWGNAIDFFDSSIKNGELNADRNLLQFINGYGDKPQVNDLIVFPYTKYGHVAIVSEVGSHYIEVIQQNVGIKSRQRYELDAEKGYKVGGKALGWLRKR